MRPALGPLCFIIAVFLNSIVVDAMPYHLRKLRAARLNNVRAGMYVTMYVLNEGSFHGYLNNIPNSRGELPHVPNSLLVQLPLERGLIAYLQRLHIEPTEHLQESRYYIDTGKFYVFSGVFVKTEQDYDARVKLVLDLSVSRPSQVILNADMKYFEHGIPNWVDKSYNYRHSSNRQLIDTTKYLHSVPVPSPIYSYGGDEHGKRDNYHLQAGNYVTMFIVDVGAFSGTLYSPAGRHYEPYRLFVKLSNGITFGADMKPLKILGDEHIAQNFYFIQIGKPFVLRGALRFQDAPQKDHVMLKMQPTHNPQLTSFEYGELSYYEGRIPSWTEKTYKQLQTNPMASSSSTVK